MDWIAEPARKTPVAADTDVLVCGGGFAGVAAAVCAARQGVRVLLLERYGFLGGLVTGGLVITTPPLDNGLNREIGARLRRKRVYAPLHKPGAEMIALKMHAIDPEVVKQELVDLLREARVELLLHSLIVGSIVEAGVVNGVLVENKAGRQGRRPWRFEGHRSRDARYLLPARGARRARRGFGIVGDTAGDFVRLRAIGRGHLGSPDSPPQTIRRGAILPVFSP